MRDGYQHYLRQHLCFALNCCLLNFLNKFSLSFVYPISILKNQELSLINFEKILNLTNILTNFILTNTEINIKEKLLDRGCRFSFSLLNYGSDKNWFKYILRATYKQVELFSRRYLPIGNSHLRNKKHFINKLLLSSTNFFLVDHNLVDRSQVKTTLTIDEQIEKI